MTDEALARLIVNTSGLLAKFERHCVGIEQELMSSVHRLDTTTRRIPDTLQHTAEGVLRHATQPVLRLVGAELQASVREHRQYLGDAGRQAQDAANALSQHVQDMRLLHRHLIWKIVGVTALSLVLLLVGGMWLSMHYAEVIRSNQISAELMEAYRQSDVVRCEGRLCARVDGKGKRYGEKGEYVPIRLR